MSGRTTHHSLEERLEAVLLYLSGQVGSSRLAKQYGVSGHTVQDWARAYQHDGVGLERVSHLAPLLTRTKAASLSGLLIREI